MCLCREVNLLSITTHIEQEFLTICPKDIKTTTGVNAQRATTQWGRCHADRCSVREYERKHDQQDYTKNQ